VRSDNCDDYSAEHNYEDRSRRIVSRPAGSGSLLPSVGGPQLVREPRLARVAEYKNHTRAVPGRRRLYPTRGAWPKQFWSASTLQLLECKGPDGPACLTAAQVEAARTVYSPATNPRTKQQISAGLAPGGELGWLPRPGRNLAGSRMAISSTWCSKTRIGITERYDFAQDRDSRTGVALEAVDDLQAPQLVLPVATLPGKRVSSLRD
jgi:hypothetical protein